ncbi:MAG: signal peptidase I, partial [Planctomycetes bacterium]|nr:signal peptidase I [Planctomycetota bacterium]
MRSRRSFRPPPFDSDRRGAGRSLCESFISLFIAVLLFRTFAAEGYMISTGSMAPSLLGFHKRVECPTCKFTFPFGVAYDTDDESDSEDLDRVRSSAICPNCGQKAIDLTEVPRNHGDQLLVNKQAYLYQSPERWEVVVFRNPAKSTEAYVKRVVGLPGEKIQIRNGDIVVNGRLARKDWDRQRAMRILVHDHSFQPIDDPNYEVHWQPVEEDARDLRAKDSAVGFQSAGHGFFMKETGERRSERLPFHWIEYRHWIRSGGFHTTTVPLGRWPSDVPISSVPAIGLVFKEEHGQLSCPGVLPKEMSERISGLSNDVAFRAAINQLSTASHVAPFIDEYGYNPHEGGTVPNFIRDVMFSGRVRWSGVSGEFAVQMSIGQEQLLARFDP